MRRMAFLFALCVPAYAQPSPRVVDQINFPKTVDLSASSWTDAFTTLNKILSREYPFTHWRRIDWTQLYNKYSTRIADAERRNDFDAFRQILREYIYSFPDGHVQIHGRFDDLRYREIGGGFGFALTPLDDGRVVSYMVIDGSPAAKAGIQPGAEILSLDGKPIKDAALAVSVLWTRKPVSTSAQRRIEQRHKPIQATNVYHTFFESALEPGQALAQRPRLPFAHGDLSGRSVGHDKQKAALEVRLDLFDLRHIDQHLAARTEELMRQGGFKFGKLVVHPERVFRCRRTHNAILRMATVPSPRSP